MKTLFLHKVYVDLSIASRVPNGRAIGFCQKLYFHTVGKKSSFFIPLPYSNAFLLKANELTVNRDYHYT